MVTAHGANPGEGLSLGPGSWRSPAWTPRVPGCQAAVFSSSDETSTAVLKPTPQRAAGGTHGPQAPRSSECANVEHPLVLVPPHSTGATQEHQDPF
ncbi:hypothetical protein NHX12_022314 [Muraenolepis orangiensis]|uniref:Uncharacterized protein n=1 Tax=Muraenolepis orangiensis TaxID=630683 RepID=A0A9Q0ERC2_9TELE|nr:hypothetical protein NHX12_022314 [Muraenolepis orangiensis]